VALLKSHKTQTLLEEIGNATTHGLGALLSVIALIALIATSIHQGGGNRIFSSILFGSSLLFMYTASTIYHSVTNQKKKTFFKIIDHASIYLLIAGSYTPFMLVTLNDFLGISFFCLIWGIALTGVVFKIFFVHHVPKLSVTLYLLMGWLAVFLIKPIYQHLPGAGLAWLIAGGLSYTLGVVFYIWKRLYFSHTLWHLFVLAGSSCHFFAVYLYVLK
jgi:hemolysin III